MTLVEVLVALGLFAFAVIGLMAAMRGVLDAESVVRVDSAARRELENQMALLQARKAGEFRETITISSPPMTITKEIKRETITRTNGPLDGFWRVRIKAEWTVGGKPSETEATFLRYSP